jgi:hypothetical protein
MEASLGWASEQVLLPEAHEVLQAGLRAGAKDYVVQHLDADDLPGLDELPGGGDVLSAGGGGAAGVVMLCEAASYVK